jgi:diaminobutyrate-2-oxoglutarate transaminase
MSATLSGPAEPRADHAADPRAVFFRRESTVRSYCRSFPAVFVRAKSATMWDEDGRAYIDFFAGAGTMNYGHNPPPMVEALVTYLSGDGIVHSLDLHTAAKRAFFEEFERIILAPRAMPHRIQCPGPTGTNAVEAALKLARKATRRRTVVAFSNGYHGMTLGALAVTANPTARAGAGVPLPHVRVAPYEGHDGHDTTAALAATAHVLAEAARDDGGTAALILECVQGEGGINAASPAFLRGVADLARQYGALLIVDDIQAGCGRTGHFFSFEPAGITPDIVLLSKAIGGAGMPMALVLLRPELDLWQPGEHNGTFRGFNLAFVAATAALRHFWQTGDFAEGIAARARAVRAALETIVAEHPLHGLSVRGRGLMQGVHCPDPAFAARVAAAAWTRGLVIERSGRADEVVKLMPPLVISESELQHGLSILAEAVRAAHAA